MAYILTRDRWRRQPTGYQQLSAEFADADVAVLSPSISLRGHFPTTLTASRGVSQLGLGYAGFGAGAAVEYTTLPTLPDGKPYTLIALWTTSSASGGQQVLTRDWVNNNRRFQFRANGAAFEFLVFAGGAFTASVANSVVAGRLNVSVGIADSVNCHAFINGSQSSPAALGTPASLQGPDSTMRVGSFYDDSNLLSGHVAAWLRIPRNIPLALAREVSRSPEDFWGLVLRPQTRRIFLPAATGGAGVSVGLAGVAATAAVGTLGKTAVKALSGVEASAAVGTLAAKVGQSAALTGINATAAVGTLSKSVARSLTGVEATGAVGTLSARTGQSAALTGIEASAAVGTLSLEIDVGLTGVAATAAVGNLSVSTPKTVELTGLEASAAVGTLSASSGLTLTQKCDLVLKLLMNKQVTDPATGVMTVYDDDDVTPLYTANVYEDAAGTTLYRAQGIERRERLRTPS